MIYNELGHYVAALEVLADVVRQHLELDADMQQRGFAQLQLKNQLAEVSRAKQGIAESAQDK